MQTAQEKAIEVHLSFTIDFSALALEKKPLGQGAFGIVHKAEYKKTKVAVKQFLVTDLSSAAVQEFINEVQVMASAGHPNIIRIYGYCPSPRCIVMEYMPRGSLRDFLYDSKEALPWTRRLSIAYDIVAGLRRLHADNILHRDIKSDNILLDKHYTARLTDFGLSKIKSESRSKTRTGSIGTYPWMAPELDEPAFEYDKKSDIYSLGLVFWELASRSKPPFHRYWDRVEKIPGWVNVGKLEKEEVPADCPPDFKRLIDWCREVSPEERPETEVVYIDLERINSLLASPADEPSSSSMGEYLPRTVNETSDYRTRTLTSPQGASESGGYQPDNLRSGGLSQIAEESAVPPVRGSSEPNSSSSQLSAGSNPEAICTEIEKQLRIAATNEKKANQEKVQEAFGKALKSLEALEAFEDMDEINAKVYGLYGEYLLRQGAKGEAEKQLTIAQAFGYKPSQSVEDDAKAETLALRKAQAEEARLAKLKAEEVLKVEEARQREARRKQAEEAKRLEESRKAEELRKTQEKQKAEEAARKAEIERQTKLKAEEVRKLEETRKKAEADKKLEEARLKKVEEERKAEAVQQVKLKEEQERQAQARLEAERARKEPKSFPSAPTPSKGTVAINPQEHAQFLSFVAQGEQARAEAMLKQNPALGFAAGTVTDLSKRTFEGMTGFQYAVWALDWHMWKMLLKYLPIEEARRQAGQLDSGPWVQAHKVDAGPHLQGLIDALKTYIDKYDGWNGQQCQTHWIQQVGGAQLLLPAHVFNEYCRPDRPFHPCPNFEDERELPRTRKCDAGDDVLTAKYNGGSLGDSFGLYRGPGYGCVYVLRSGYQEGDGVGVGLDHLAVTNLFSTRAQQRDELISKLVNRNTQEPTPTRKTEELRKTQEKQKAEEALCKAEAERHTREARELEENRKAEEERQAKLKAATEAKVAPVVQKAAGISNILRFTKASKRITSNQAEVSKFLRLVAEGEQDQAEAMLRKNCELVFASGTVADLSGRTFENITGFQYAVWALDRHMWTMLRGYLPNDAAAEQLRFTGPWVSVHGLHAGMPGGPLDKLQTAYQAYMKGYSDTVWQKQVGGAQLLLPAHVINEYCRPDRPLYPCPNFEESTLPRTRTVGTVDEGEWFTAVYNGGKLGEKFGIYRAGLWGGASPFGCDELDCIYRGRDHAAVVALTKIRTQQRDKLASELSSNQQHTVKQRLGT